MPFRSQAQRRWMHANKPEMARRWEKHTSKRSLPDRVVGKALPIIGKYTPSPAVQAALTRMRARYETTHADQLDEMGEKQADAVAEAMVSEPEIAGKAKAYFALLCGKCGGIKRDRMVGKATDLPMIGKDCGCPRTHGRKGVVEFQKKGQLPIIGKWEDTAALIGRLTYATPAGHVTAPKKGHLYGSRWGKMRGDLIDAHEPKGARGPAPLTGKQSFNGVRGIDHLSDDFKEFENQMRSEKLESHADGSPDIRPSLEAMNYTTSIFNLHPGRCKGCFHSQDSFHANDHGFFITGLKCSALKGDPMVAKEGRCDLWTGVQHAEKSMRKARPSGGGWFPVGKRGGFKRMRAGKPEYWYPDQIRQRRVRKILKRQDTIAALREKTRRRGPGEGREVQLTKPELHLVLDTGRYALVSAGKNPKLEPGMTSEQQQRRHELLRSRLVQDGFAFTQVEGHYEGEEDSFLVMVHDANREHVRALGREYNQDSVIFAEGGKQEMHFTTGPHASRGECHEGKGYEFKPDAEDYFTKFPHPDGAHSKFALNFDWGKLVPCRKSMHYIDLRKGGPYVGPRGGKWADPKHTIPWKPTKGRRAHKETDEHRLKRVKRLWIDKWVGKPGESAAADGVLLKHYGEAVRHVLDGTPLSKEAEEHQVRNFGKNWRQDAKLIYEDTQKKLKAAGLSSSKVFRGVSHQQANSHELPGGGVTMDLGVYSLSSWTTNTEAAKFFAGWGNPPPPSQWGRVVVSEIAAKHIFLDHRVESRLHAAGEREVIVAPPIPPGDRIPAKAFAKPDLPKLEQHLSPEAGPMRAAARELVDYHIDDSHQMWLRKVRAQRRSDMRKSRAGASPMYYDQQASMPDFQFIYHQPRSKESEKQEREASENRRRAMADRNKGRHGFHGEPPEPQLRAEPDDYVPATQYGGKRLKDRAPEPRMIPDRMFARALPIIVGKAKGGPPPGFKPAKRSKKGGYVKVIGGKRIYWYPDDKKEMGAAELTELAKKVVPEDARVSDASEREPHPKFGRVIDITIHTKTGKKSNAAARAVRSALESRGIYGSVTRNHREMREGAHGGSRGWKVGTSIDVRVWPDATREQVETARVKRRAYQAKAEAALHDRAEPHREAWEAAKKKGDVAAMQELQYRFFNTTRQIDQDHPGGLSRAARKAHGKTYRQMTLETNRLRSRGG